MKILVATDAWHPQINGVVRTFDHLAREARALGAQIDLLTPDAFATMALPGYREIRLAFAFAQAIEGRFSNGRFDAVHIATEGPIGRAVRRLCLRRGVPFTTSFHTRFPDYLAGRMRAGGGLASAIAWRALRGFHAPSAAVMAATRSLARELTARGFPNVTLWPRGVDCALFRPRLGEAGALDLPRPIFLAVGRVSVEKNLQAFLSLDLPGSKVVVGDGPAREALARQFPAAVFLGARAGEALAQVYAAADVFVFPSRTDTFGLVLLEALASGVPVAAFPDAAPREVIGRSGTGVLDDDLHAACLGALALPRAACRDHALSLSWRASAQAFLGHVERAAAMPRAA